MLTHQQVDDAYRLLLGRHPESADRVEKCIEKFSDLSELKAAIRNSPEYEERGAGALTTLLERTDAYQSIYSFPKLSAAHGRVTLNRCETIERFFHGILKAGNIGHLSVLDVGCAQGFASLYFADRGAHVVGIDYNTNNIAFCRQLAVTSGIDAHFLNRTFSDDTPGLCDQYGVNVVMMLSVLHHVIKDRGIDWVKDVIKQLLDSGCVLICELARHDEPVPFDWRETLPKSELDIFPEGCVIHKLGEFEAMNGHAQRPLYAIHRSKVLFKSRSARGVEEEDRIVDAPDFRFSSVESVPVRVKTYQFGKDVFCKNFRLTPENWLELVRAITSEVLAVERLSNVGVGPRIFGVSYDGASATIIFERVSGTDLVNFAQVSSVSDRRKVAVAIATQLRKIADAGLHWNDCREHNILVNDTLQPVLIDFEMASPIAFEDNVHRARWMLWELVHSKNFAAQMEQKSHWETRQLPKVPDRSSVKEWDRILRLLG